MSFTLYIKLYIYIVLIHCLRNNSTNVGLVNLTGCPWHTTIPMHQMILRQRTSAGKVKDAAFAGFGSGGTTGKDTWEPKSQKACFASSTWFAQGDNIFCFLWFQQVWQIIANIWFNLKGMWMCVPISVLAWWDILVLLVVMCYSEHFNTGFDYANQDTAAFTSMVTGEAPWPPVGKNMFTWFPPPLTHSPIWPFIVPWPPAPNMMHSCRTTLAIKGIEPQHISQACSIHRFSTISMGEQLHRRHWLNAGTHWCILRPWRCSITLLTRRHQTFRIGGDCCRGRCGSNSIWRFLQWSLRSMRWGWSCQCCQRPPPSTRCQSSRQSLSHRRFCIAYTYKIK